MVVAEELHFGRAAQRLGMTQPPLSRAIRRLERRLGVTLLLRTSRQVALTAAGEVLLRDGRKALQAVDAAVRWAQRTGRDDPRLLLACKSGSDAGLLARILRAYADEPDSLPVQVVHTATERIAMLRDGRADVALLHRPSNDLAGLDTEDLLTEPQIVVLRPDHPLADRESVELAELRDEQLPRWPESAPDPAAAGSPLVGSHGDVLELVSSGRGVLVVPHRRSGVIPRAMACVPVRDAPPTTLVLAWPRESRSRAVAALARTAARVARGVEPAINRSTDPLLTGRPNRSIRCSPSVVGMTGALAHTSDPTTGPPLPAFARGPVLAVAGAVAALLTAVSWRYGYFGDELYFVAAGHHLAWGYADQPPLVPLIALLMDTVAPGSVLALRIPATLAIAAGVVLTALLAREFGGGRKAQLIAAGAFALALQFLGTGHLLATSTFDPVLWTAVTWLVVRWVRTRDDRLLLLAGLVTSVAIQVKFLIPVFWVVALLAALVVGPRELPRRPMLWLGGAIAVLAPVPTLIWQARNGWPQLGMSAAVAAESVYTGGALLFLPLALLMASLIGAVLAVHGTVRLLRDPAFRFLGLTVLGVTAIFLATGGRVYYVIGLYPMLWAASAVAIERGAAARWWRWLATWPAYAVSAVVILAVLHPLPIKPVSWLADRPVQIGNFQLDEIGWPQEVADVQAAYDALPPGVAGNAVVVTGDYWTVSAVQEYAPQLRSYSFHRGAAWFATPPEDSGAVVFVGDPTPLAPYFGSVTRVGKLDNDQRINNLTQGTPIFLLQGRTAPWSQIWPAVRRL